MKGARRIYCIEGYHDWGNAQIRPTLEPVLQLLCSAGYWSDYVHRKCVSADECNFFLDEEWAKCNEGSLLYFAAHGGPGVISLSGAPVDERCELVTLETLVERDIECGGCLVHFGCCGVFADNGTNEVKDFIRGTGASYVTGYAADVGWADIQDPPSVALELLFFGSIGQLAIDIGDDDAVKSMRRLAKDLDGLFKLRGRENFKPCEFRLCDWWATTNFHSA